MRELGTLSEAASLTDHIIIAMLVRLDFTGSLSAYSTTLTPSATTGSITLTLGSGIWDSVDVGRRVVDIAGEGEAVITGTSGSASIDAYVINPFRSTSSIASGDWELLEAAVTINTTQSTITFNNEDYLGAGELAGISATEETTEIKPTSLILSLSGLESSPNISLALNEHYQGRDARVYMAFLDSDYQLLEDPNLIFRGRMDTMNIGFDSISVTVQSRLVDWDRARVRRYTHEDQISRYPNDKGFEFVSQMVEKELYWGRPTPVEIENG